MYVLWMTINVNETHCLFRLIQNKLLLRNAWWCTVIEDVCLKVEYCACVIPGDCWNLMKEFMQSFLGSNTPELPTVFTNKPEGLCVPVDCMDTMSQYLELFSKVRKQQVMPGSGVRWNLRYASPELNASKPMSGITRCFRDTDSPARSLRERTLYKWWEHFSFLLCL